MSAYDSDPEQMEDIRRQLAWMRATQIFLLRDLHTLTAELLVVRYMVKAILANQGAATPGQLEAHLAPIDAAEPAQARKRVEEALRLLESTAAEPPPDDTAYWDRPQPS